MVDDFSCNNQPSKSKSSVHSVVLLVQVTSLWDLTSLTFCCLSTSQRPFSRCFLSEFLKTNFFSQYEHWYDSLGAEWLSKCLSSLSLVLDRWAHWGHAKGRLLCSAMLCRFSSVRVRKLMGHWEHFSLNTSPAWIFFLCMVKSYRVGQFCKQSLHRNPIWSFGAGAWSWRMWACNPDLV